MRLSWSLFVVSLLTNLLKEKRLKGTFPVYLKNFSRISFEFPEEFAKSNKRNLKIQWQPRRSSLKMTVLKMLFVNLKNIKCDNL